MQKTTEMHRKALKGGPFKLNMAAKLYFDENPYRSDRPLGSGKKSGVTKTDVKPFKPSSPGKEVCCTEFWFCMKVKKDGN